MKPSHYIIAFLFFLGMSCKKGASPAPPPSEKTLTLTANKTQCLSDGFDEIIFKVVNENGVDVTTSATITLIPNGIGVSNSKTYISIPGTYTYKASIGSVQSLPISIQANAPPPSPYRKNAYLENVMSAGAGTCYEISVENTTITNTMPYCIIADFHVNDSMQTPEASLLLTQYALGNAPFRYLNRQTTHPFGSVVPFVKEDTMRRAALGIAIESIIAGNSLNFKVKVGFSVNCTFPLTVSCFLVEDSLIYNQARESNNPTVVGFIHNNVYRKSLFDVRLGDPIPLSVQTNGTVWEKNYSFDLSGVNPARSKLVVFVQYGANGYAKSGVLNVQGVKAGQNKGFN